MVEQTSGDDGNEHQAILDSSSCEPVTIHLEYMCSTCTYGRRLFGHETLADREEGMSILRRKLNNQVVSKNSISFIPLGFSDDIDLYTDGVFFMVSEAEAQGKPLHDKQCINLKPDSFRVTLVERSTAHEKDSSIEVAEGSEEEYICPGYESTLQELLTMAQTRDQRCSPTAVVISGCPGVGKTRMASWFAETLSRTQSVSTTVVSAKNVLLDESVLATFGDNATGSSRRLLIIDDLDALAATSASPESEQLQALNSIVKLIDKTTSEPRGDGTFIVGITRATWGQLPPQLARVGRFERAVEMPPPTLSQRRDVFRYWIATLPIGSNEGGGPAAADEWASLLSPRTAGCVAADIRRICSDALASAYARAGGGRGGPSVAGSLIVSWEVMKEAARNCIPSQLAAMDVIPASLGDFDDGPGPVDLRREFELAWSGFEGYGNEKKRLFRNIVRPWKYHIMNSSGGGSDAVDRTLSDRPSGVLFHGPPGCGKTEAAMRLASCLGLHCVKVRASEVFDQWLGGSEATLRSIFSRARSASPCVLFFDELDSLATNREGGESAGDSASCGVQSRVLTTLLNEMDGITSAGGRQDVLVVGATNRKGAIDAALLRPGRLEEHVLLSYPSASDATDILEMRTAKMPLDGSVDSAKMGEAFEGAKTSCADIDGICRDACLIALRRCEEDGVDDEELAVTSGDFDEAFHRIKGRHLADISA